MVAESGSSEFSNGNPATDDKFQSEEMRGSYISEFFTSPVNVVLIGICVYILYKLLKRDDDHLTPPVFSQQLPPLKKKDYTLEELKEFDGKREDGRILMAVNGKVFDVTRGKRFYGPGEPYGVFAGRDASRGLATMSLDENTFSDQYDDLSDLATSQLDIVRDWEMQFIEKYDVVGRLLKPGEEPKDYESEQADDNSCGDDKKKD